MGGRGDNTIVGVSGCALVDSLSEGIVDGLDESPAIGMDGCVDAFPCEGAAPSGSSGTGGITVDGALR